MSKRPTWDPRKMIGGPSWPCPSCGKSEFGTLHISERQITRRCRNCLHTASEALPAPRERRIIYLDQFALSNMAKTLDPVWRAERRKQTEVWTRLFDALDRALKLHLVVSPESRIQELESVVHPHYELLQRLYEHLASETRFQFPTQIHGIQLRFALRAKLAGETPDFSLIRRADVISGKVAAWMERMSIKAHFGAGFLDPEALRRARDLSGKAMQTIFERWRLDKPSFEQAYAQERAGLAEATIQLLRQHLELQRNVALGLAPPSDALWNYRLEVGVVMSLIAIGRQAGLSEADAFKLATEFIYSEEALSAPMNEISALMMAGVAARATMGQKRVPSPGMWNDITAISAFVPYCDAMVVDNECAELLNDGRIQTRLPYPARVYSTRSLDDFIKYLEALELEAGPEWRDLIVRIYGSNWLQPYRLILEHTRDRQNRAR